VVRNGKVLLGRRSVDPSKGSWDIPGGFVVAWEHPAEAAIREVREETGLEVRVTRLIEVTVDTYADSVYTLNLYYLAEVVGGIEKPGDDLAELKWFSATELPSDLAFPTSAQVLATWKSD